MRDYFMTSESDGGLYDTRVDGWSAKPPLRANYARHYRQIDSVAEFKATLRAGGFAWPGGYPFAFYASDGGTICFDCARKEARNVMDSIRHDIRDGWKIVACDIEYGETESRCDHCESIIAEGMEE